MKRLRLLIVWVIACFLIAGVALAGETLDAVKAQGFVKVGVNGDVFGFSMPDEMGFAKSVAYRVMFMDFGRIVEENTPEQFFEDPQHDRTKLFLSQILH